MGDIASGALGSNFSYDVAFTAGVGIVTIKGPDGVTAAISIPAKGILDGLAKAIPNVFVDELIKAAEAGLGLG